jgi:fructose-1,6-bisphosphatase/inositol monophosphatase family enzyme
MQLRQSPLVQQHKADHSLVTNADFAADQLIREGLRAAFPSDAILTEESGLQGSPQSEFLWVVDPLDGTRAYAKGKAGFSVMIGLLKGGLPYIGVVADPLEKRSYEAERGLGAYCDGRLVHVSERTQWDQLRVVTSTGFPEKAAAELKRTMTGAWLEPINSVGIKVGLLAREAADIYINHHQVHYWDTCAPLVILEEAGGQMTYLGGAPLLYPLDGRFRHAGPTLATNRHCHQQALSHVAAVLS